METTNPYDEFAYKCQSIEWTAPERLAAASFLHDGPRQCLSNYRTLELGCGDGANLLPLSYYRRQASFVGVDGAHNQIDIANSWKSELNLNNIEFLHADFVKVDNLLDGEFDFIIAHGVFSWIADHVRDALFQLCSKRLRKGGLLYLNYNCKPGWNVRGMVRNFLLTQTAEINGLRNRAKFAQYTASNIASSLKKQEHPYSQLLANEFGFVCENHASYIAHEYLATDNHAYWRSEFLDLARQYDLEYVADANFNYPATHPSQDFLAQLEQTNLANHRLNDTIDFLCYRQLHTPIFTRGRFVRIAPSTEEFSKMLVAASLTPSGEYENKNPLFQHPSGYKVEVKETEVEAAFLKLRTIWPHGILISELFSDPTKVVDDLKLLQRNGLLELRFVEPARFNNTDQLYILEKQKGYFTTPFHTRISLETKLCNHQNSEVNHVVHNESHTF